MIEYKLKDFFQTTHIPMEDLVIGATYFCKARNFTEGVWNGKNFDYMRYKFGATFPDTEEHWDTGAPYGTVKPYVRIDKE